MSAIVTAHGYVIGFAVVGAWLTICFWALALRLIGYEETPTFWRAVSVAQLLLVLQLVVGLVLFVAWAFGAAGLPGTGSAWDVIWHPLYGVVFPVVVLVAAHKWSRENRYNPHTLFSLAGLIIFGLTARAWMTGVFGA